MLIRKFKKLILLILASPFIIIGRLAQIVKSNANAPEKTFYELERIAYRESAEYIYKNLKGSVLLTSRKDFWTHALATAPKDGLLMEFGVFRGESIRYFAKLLTKTKDKRHFFGFDSFEGLSENWGGFSLMKAKFDRGGKLPSVPSNVSLIKGWVDDTYVDALKQHLPQHNNQIALLHLDMDTYTPTKYVLEQSIPYLVEGSVIAFDEMFGYTGWKENEFKAFIEVIEPIFDYEYISFAEYRTRGYVSVYTRAAIKIIAKK